MREWEKRQKNSSHVRSEDSDFLITFIHFSRLWIREREIHNTQWEKERQRMLCFISLYRVYHWPKAFVISLQRRPNSARGRSNFRNGHVPNSQSPICYYTGPPAWWTPADAGRYWLCARFCAMSPEAAGRLLSPNTLMTLDRPHSIAVWTMGRDLALVALE